MTLGDAIQQASAAGNPQLEQMESAAMVGGR